MKVQCNLKRCKYGFCVTYAGKLAVQCEREELPQYAGLCWTAAARCENSLGNASGEAWDLVRAGRQFLTAEISAKDLGCPSPGGEHVQVLLMCSLLQKQYILNFV